MSGNDLSLVAHLIRRAGFGATRDEIEAFAAKGYDALVEDLLHPERFPEVEQDVLSRYYGDTTESEVNAATFWIYRDDTRDPKREVE